MAAKAKSKNQDYAMKFIVYSLATFFGVYFALLAVRFLERLDMMSLLIGAIFGAIGLYASAKIILHGIDLHK